MRQTDGAGNRRTGALRGNIAILSLGCCVFCVAIWPRSLVINDTVHFITPSDNSYMLGTAPGGLLLARITHWRELAISYEKCGQGWSVTSEHWGDQQSRTFPPTPFEDAGGLIVTKMWMAPDHHFLGFAWESKPASGPTLAGSPSASLSYHTSRLVLPLWFMASLFAGPTIKISLTSIRATRTNLMFVGRSKIGDCLGHR